MVNRGFEFSPANWQVETQGDFHYTHMNPVTLHLFHWYGLALLTLMLGAVAVFPRLSLWLWRTLDSFPEPIYAMTEGYTLRHCPLSGQLLSALTDQNALVLYRAQCPNITTAEYNAVGQRIRELHRAGAQQMLRNTSAVPYPILQSGPLKDNVY